MDTLEKLIQSTHGRSSLVETFKSTHPAFPSVDVREVYAPVRGWEVALGQTRDRPGVRLLVAGRTEARRAFALTLAQEIVAGDIQLTGVSL